MKHPRIHPAFRALAWILGPLMIGGALLVTVMLVGESRTGGLEGLHELLFLIPAMIALGAAVLYAAWTGLDPLADRQQREERAAANRGPTIDGARLAAERERLGIPLEELALGAKLEPGIVRDWERFDLEIPPEATAPLLWSLWVSGSRRRGDARGLASCDWMGEAERSERRPSPLELGRHIRDCEQCSARLEAMSDPEPEPVGFRRFLAQPAVASVVVGIGFLLIMTGVGILALLGQAIWRRDAWPAIQAAGLIALCIAAGTAGGLTHHAVRRLRERGNLGLHVSWILVVLGCLVGVVCVLALAMWLPGLDALDAEVRPVLEWVFTPQGVAVLAAIGVVFGIAAARGAIGQRDATIDGESEDDWSTLEDDEPPTRFATIGNGLKTAFTIASVGFLLWVGMADEARPQRTPAERLSEAQEAADRNPDDADALRDYAEALGNLGRVTEAIPVLERALQIQPGDAHTHYILGWSLAQVGRFDESLVAYREAARLAPNRAAAHHGIGWALFRLGRYDESTVAYAESLRLENDNADGHVGYARALGAAGHPEEAAREARIAIEQNPDNPWGHAVFATASIQLGEPRQAVESAREAVRLEPIFPGHHETLARALLADADYAAAEEAYLATIRLAPGTPRVWLQLARIAHMNGHLARADSAFARADALLPGYFDSAEEDRELWQEVRRGMGRDGAGG